MVPDLLNNRADGNTQNAKYGNDLQGAVITWTVGELSIHSGNEAYLNVLFGTYSIAPQALQARKQGRDDVDFNDLGEGPVSALQGLNGK